MNKYNLKDLTSADPDVKYGMQKKILGLSETAPGELYADFDFFAALLDNKNNIMRWTGILVLGNLAKVDTGKKIDKVLPTLIGMLNTGKMITAANTIKALTAIAKSRPEVADKLALEIIKVKQYRYDSTECNSIATGHALKNLGQIWTLCSPATQGKLIDFAKSETSNSRPATTKKASEFLKKYS